MSRRATDKCVLLLENDPVMWSSFFKYLGFVSGTEGIRFQEDSVVAGVTKVTRVLQSGCTSAVALPISRLVDLHHALVDPIALLNGVAWVPFLERGGP